MYSLSSSSQSRLQLEEAAMRVSLAKRSASQRETIEQDTSEPADSDASVSTHQAVASTSTRGRSTGRKISPKRSKNKLVSAGRSSPRTSPSRQKPGNQENFLPDNIAIVPRNSASLQLDDDDMDFTLSSSSSMTPSIARRSTSPNTASETGGLVRRGRSKSKRKEVLTPKKESSAKSAAKSLSNLMERARLPSLTRDRSQSRSRNGLFSLSSAARGSSLSPKRTHSGSSSASDKSNKQNGRPSSLSPRRKTDNSKRKPPPRKMLQSLITSSTIKLATDSNKSFSNLRNVGSSALTLCTEATGESKSTTASSSAAAMRTCTSLLDSSSGGAGGDLEQPKSDLGNLLTRQRTYTAEPPPTEKDLDFRLTEEVHMSWELVKDVKNYQEVLGGQILFNMMSSDPTIRHMLGLQSFQSAEFAKWCTKIVQLLNSMVTFLGPDLDPFSMIGARWQKEGFPPDFFPTFPDAVCAALADALKDDYNEDTNQSWSTFLSFVVHKITTNDDE